ncbi:MAG TPA: glycosyltransferase family 39 protein [Candidatus Binatia bacterium]|nr:glycosyltransferase family 39 protein [Candidatus Binatia bacterium]
MKCLLLPLALLLLVAAIRTPLLGIPFERDEGEYAYIGWRLDYHELPYRDWIDQKPPAIFWVYWAALRLPLDPIHAVHLMGLLFSMGTALALFFLARHFTRPLWAALASALTALLSADPLAQGTAANTELFMLLPLVLSQWIFCYAISSGSGAVPMLLAGALTGLAVAFKQVAGLNVLLLLGLIFWVHRQKPWQGLRAAGWLLAGTCLVWGLVAACFLIHRALRDLVYNVFTHNLEYVGALSWAGRWQHAKDTLAVLARTEVMVWVFALIGLVQLFVNRRQAGDPSPQPSPLMKGRGRSLPPFVFATGWLLSSLLGVAASGYFFAHYFQQTIPPLCLAAALGAESVGNIRWWKPVPAWVRGSSLGLALAVLPVITLAPFAVSTPAQAAARIYPGEPFAHMPELGRRLAEVTAPAERVFVFGAEPELFFYARRVSASRYIFLFPLYGPYRDARQMQSAAAEEVERNRPATAVFMPNRLFLLPGSEQFFTRWAFSYLRSNFRADSLLTVDSNGAIQLLTAPEGQQPSLPKGQQMMASLLIRKREN